MKNLNFYATALLIVVIISSLLYYLLLCDNILNTSIQDIIHYAHSLTVDKHILVLGLLPIYIGVMIFGATWLGVYVGKKIQQLFSKTANATPFDQKKD